MADQTWITRLVFDGLNTFKYVTELALSVLLNCTHTEAFLGIPEAS